MFYPVVESSEAACVAGGLPLELLSTDQSSSSSMLSGTCKTLACSTCNMYIGVQYGTHGSTFFTNI